MKRLLVFSYAFFIGFIGLYAQPGPVGFTNIDAIVFNLPDIEKINEDLETYRSALSDQLNVKNEQFNLYLEAFQKLKDNPETPDSVLQAKQLDFINRQSDVQNFKAEAEQIFANKQAELFNPLYERVRIAVEEVRKDKGMSLIINTHAGANAGIILAYSEEVDITRAVFEKLDVPFPKNFEPAVEEDGN